MIAVFTWTGFACLMALVLALTLFAIFLIAEWVVKSARVTRRFLRVFWRFYDTIPKGESSMRYVATVYDRRENRFIVTECVDGDFLTYDEREEKWRKIRESMRKKITEVGAE